MANKLVEYKASVAGDLKRLDRKIAARVVRKIGETLLGAGETGKSLSGPFAGLFSLRVADYRVSYVETARGYLVLRIGHRREVYRKGRPAEE
ncbi:MAG: type II toxin-antitoxin system RelE/ParE family toxin [Planctomycetes bacterium]|nr:type II toxin-antitoxin system RelE/ParE family toxin [Planctomycetota bacterium]